ncbi:glucokinase [Thiomicrospira aerophila AL3]|uniref:Glucokinase n=1 Tax=Thiomicrospira aerophila AL3 TaxID=717772 RepID=W0DTK8_9GAMM|nr:glucokinase [Thiomicrospira aerophila]AHF01767.1 glucokinase [Thiomicrospira aerophila AL3]
MLYYLVADIGGTHSRFQAWSRSAEQGWRCEWQQRYASCAYASFDLLLDQLEVDAPNLTWNSVVFGVAGPVHCNQVQLTNLNWFIDALALERRFKFAKVALLNDFTIAAYALDSLADTDYQTLHPPLASDVNGRRLLVGAGTGLGVALLQGQGAGLSVVATEAGHVDFSPFNEFDCRLQAWLMQSWDHVSFERLVSGDGLTAIYQFLAQQSQFDPRLGPLAAEIAQQAETGEQLAIQAITQFWGYYGQFIGNMTLCWPATAGIWIAGGMAPKLTKWLDQSAFYERLWQKGRMSSLVKNCGVHLVLAENLGLLGARQCAHYQLQ